ncbi:MAG: uracil phosphoribosyltransferase [Candidatus Riflebacteria bacterium]|nr:uracil phosphoribosyltransferase [Candidatus Riflebacteria bacterium]
MSKVTVLDHPLIQHKLTLLRDARTDVKLFREAMEELSGLMAYEITRDVPLRATSVRTPLGVDAQGQYVDGLALGVVPILRAGLGMIHGILQIVPMAPVGHIGIWRDPDTLEPHQYFCKLPKDSDKRTLIVVDPMLATGGSAVDAITLIKSKGAGRIKFNCILAAPEGVEVLTKAHPDVEVYAAAVDERLNEHGYILPGLGDAGDRLFGTK